MEKKMTKKDMFGRLIDIVNAADVEDASAVVDFLNHEIELVSKKRSGMTKTQKENEVLVEVVYEAIENAGKPVTATEVYEMVKSDKLASAQKVSALITKLKNAGRVERVAEGRKALFKVAD